MKKHIVWISLMIIFTALLSGCNLNRVGTDEYYVHITGNGKEDTSKFDDGEEYSVFKYELAGFDEDGQEKQWNSHLIKTFVQARFYGFSILKIKA